MLKNVIETEFIKGITNNIFVIMTYGIVINTITARFKPPGGQGGSVWCLLRELSLPPIVQRHAFGALVNWPLYIYIN